MNKPAVGSTASDPTKSNRSLRPYRRPVREPWYQNTGNLAYWRVECDADARGTYGAGPVDNNVSAKGYQLTYVAPWVDADTEIRVKATYRTGDGCASSTLRFTVLDDDDR